MIVLRYSAAPKSTCPVHFLRSIPFVFNDPATTEIYTLSLHDALPISSRSSARRHAIAIRRISSSTPSPHRSSSIVRQARALRSEEHTSELQSHSDLVCRLLLEKKKNTLTRSTKQVMHDTNVGQGSIVI